MRTIAQLQEFLEATFEFVYTPKHGSWLNMAEIELNVMIAQWLNRRVDNIDTLRSEVAEFAARTQAEHVLGFAPPFVA